MHKNIRNHEILGIKPTVNFFRVLYIVIVYFPDGGIRNDQKITTMSLIRTITNELGFFL
jgi:hypothetical protein